MFGYRINQKVRLINRSKKYNDGIIILIQYDDKNKKCEYLVATKCNKDEKSMYRFEYSLIHLDRLNIKYKKIDNFDDYMTNEYYKFWVFEDEIEKVR